MFDFLEEWLIAIQNAVEGNPYTTALVVFLVPYVEAIIPVLPLTFIVAISSELISYIVVSPFLAKTLTILLSFAGTYFGAITVYYVIRFLLRERIYNKYKDNKHYKNVNEWVDNANTVALSFLLSLPVLPISLFNVAFALSSGNKVKYFIVTGVSRFLMISYVVVVWGNIRNIRTSPIPAIISIVFVVGILTLGYIINKRMNNKTKISEN